MASRPPPLDYAPSIQNHTVRRTTPVADPCSLLHSTPSPTNNHHCQQDTMSCDGDDDGTNYGGTFPPSTQLTPGTCNMEWDDENDAWICTYCGTVEDEWAQAVVSW